MAPHSMNDNQNNDQHHRRAKSNRIAPAIPYALVKPKPKASHAVDSSADQTRSKAASPPAENSQRTTVQRSMTPVQTLPSTPASVASSHEKSAQSSATATDGFSDRNLDSEGSKLSIASEATSSPSTQAALSPNQPSGRSTKPSIVSPSKSSASSQHPPNNVSSSDSIDEHITSTTPSVHGSLNPTSQPERQIDQPTNGGHVHSRNGSDVVSLPHLSNGPPPMQLNTVSLPHPQSMVPPTYNTEFMSPPITSPTSGWNPNANFIPPSHQIHTSRRSIHDSMSPRAASHKSSASDAHSMKPIVPITFTQPLPPIDIFPWSSYINTFYSNSRFADFSLVPSKSDLSRGSPEFPVHGLIIAKSSVLSHLIQRLPNNPRRNDSGQTYLTLDFDEHITSYRAVLEAIGHLYGQPLPHYGEGLPINAPIEVLMDRMTSTLSLAGAGQYLGLPEVMSHGLAFAVDFINWHTFEKALAFAQASMNSLSSFQEADTRSNELIKVMYHYHSNLMFRLERFLIDNFPKKFQFLPSASELTEARRLPATVEARPSVSHARLASIQFGDMPTPDPSFVQSDSLLSSILLSVPTAIIGRFLESPELLKRLGRANLISMMTEVVHERERRRTKSSTSKGVTSKISQTQQEELKWMEVLEQHPQTLLGVIINKVPVEQE